MPDRLEFTAGALRDFRRAPREVQERFAALGRDLMENPTRRRAGFDVRKLKGTTAAYRLRIGDHRVIFEIEGRAVVVTRVGRREGVYD